MESGILGQCHNTRHTPIRKSGKKNSLVLLSRFSCRRNVLSCERQRTFRKLKLLMIYIFQEFVVFF